MLRAVGEATEVIDTYLDDVHEDRVLDENGTVRWGSGEGRIDRVELLDRDGQSVRTVRTGDPLTIRLHYALDEPIDKPVFGLSINTLEGATVTGPNTRQAGAVPDRLEGTGFVDYRVDEFMLVAGTYDLTVSIFDYSCTHPYDYRQRVIRFDVERGTPAEEYGVMALGGVWEGSSVRGLES